MKTVVVSAVHNEEKHIGKLLESLLAQTRMPDEIVLVDDGSQDSTAEVIERYAQRHPVIRFIRNSNQGPATSRNIAWRAARSDVVIFTDGDCVPDPDWIEKLMECFEVESAVAAAGTYRTLNKDRVLARFVGHEIAWRYRNAPSEVDAHGAYNLAVRKNVLEEMNGFEESYKVPSGEDWDLTYRISRKYKILYTPEAVVAHAHPEVFWEYMKNQVRRGYDRIKLYNDYPEKRSGDVYTGRIVKYQVLAAGLFPFTLFLMPFQGFRLIPLAFFLFLFGTCWNSFGFICKRDPSAAFYGVGVQFARCFAWAWGAFKGVLRFGFKLRK
jgi:glycosyltransferase involved in cell wall biosynthesis